MTPTPAGRGRHSSPQRPAASSAPALNDLVAAARARAAAADAVPRRAPGSPIPLLPAQRRLWLLASLDPESPQYNLPGAWKVTGPLQVAALERALRTIVARHEALRASFITVDGEPRQLIAPHARLRVGRIDLSALSTSSAQSALPADVRSGAALRVRRAVLWRAFELARAPLCRVAVITSEPEVTPGYPARETRETRTLLVALHHLIADAWSLGILYRELAALYDADLRRRTPELPPVALAFGDYAVWAQAREADAAWTASLAYWSTQLADLPVLELPADRPRVPRRTARGARQRIRISDTRTTALKALARQARMTPFAVIAGLTAAWLYRSSGQRDFAIGIPIANRTRRDMEGTIGFFVNTLALRVRLSGRTTFRAAIAQLQHTLLDALQHQAVAFDRIVEAVRPDRRRGEAPLCQVMLSFQQAPDVALTLGDATVERVWFDEETARFDMTLSLVDQPGGFGGSLNYSADLFDAQTIARMAGQFDILLDAMLASPDTEIGAVPLVSEAEWRVWTGPEPSATAAALAAPAHVWVEAAAARHPHRLAIIGEDVRVTYGEMNARANELARRLMRCGAGPGERVAVLCDRSPDWVIALLAIIKAGAAFVGLDPAYPAGRLRQMLDLAAPCLLLETPRLSDAFTGALADAIETTVPRVRLDAQAPQLAREETLDPRTPVSTEAPAYLVFTSGSTGTPKGVAVPHRALTNSALAVIDRARLTEEDRFLAYASPSVDVSSFQIFPALMAGGAVALHPQPSALSNAEIGALCDALAVTVLDLPAGFWRQWIAEQAAQARALPSSVRVFMTGGESVPGDMLRAWGDLAKPDARFISSYGPTEAAAASMFVTTGDAARACAETWLPIGQPIPDVSIHVLDQDGQPTPVGLTGELYLGGLGVAHGYWRAPALTAERFVPHPSGGGARLYRTGDHARVRADGAIEFRGRRDQQVKMRGFRIETAEIEAHLRQYPGVTQAAVVLMPIAGDPQLVAYVVLRDDGAASEGDVRRFLRERLPDHFVPARVMFLSALPWTALGKLDRRALPEPGLADRDAADAGDDALTPIEEILAGVWSQLLGVTLTAARHDDDFFALGGHSLLAARLVSRVRDTFDVDVPLRMVFEHSSLRAMAEQIAVAVAAMAEAGAIGTSPTPALQPRPAGVMRGPLAPAQQSLWFLQQLEPHRHSYVNLDRLRLHGPLRYRLLAASLDDLVRRHEALRTRFRDEGGRPVQIVEPFADAARNVVWRLSVIDVEGCPPAACERLERRIALDLRRATCDLAHGPLLRTAVIRLAADDHIACFAMHHIISDGWSMGLLVDDLSRAYRARLEGRRDLTPPLAVQMLDYALWQQSWRASDEVRRKTEVWSARVQAAATWMELPYDRPRRTVHRFRGARVPIAFSVDESHALRAWSRAEGVTPFMTLLTAFQMLLHGYTGQERILVMAPMANRGRTETESLIGLFMNHVPLVAHFDPQATLRQLLRQARATTIEAFAHQDLPFDDIVARVQPERSANQVPLHQAVFNVLNVPMRPLALPDLTIDRPSVAGPVAAKFDLAVALDDTRDRIAGAIDYDRDLFDAATVERMAADYRDSVQRLMTQPDQRVADLSLMTAAQARLLGQFFETITD